MNTRRRAAGRIPASIALLALALLLSGCSVLEAKYERDEAHWSAMHAKANAEAAQATAAGVAAQAQAQEAVAHQTEASVRFLGFLAFLTAESQSGTGTAALAIVCVFGLLLAVLLGLKAGDR